MAKRERVWIRACDDKVIKGGVGNWKIVLSNAGDSEHVVRGSNVDISKVYALARDVAKARGYTDGFAYSEE